MTPWFSSFALWLADFYLVATMLLTAAAVFRLGVKQPARRMALVWGAFGGLALAAILCQAPSRPRFDLQRHFTHRDVPSASIASADAQALTTPVVDAAIPKTGEATAPRSASAPATAVSPRSLATRTPPRPLSIDVRTVAAVVAACFLFGAALVALRLTSGVRQAHRLVRRSVAASPALVDELRAIAGADSRLPRLCVSSDVATPVATGALRPTILLPQHFAAPGRALQAVLAHEWAHIRNGDLWLLALDRCLLPLLWAHPLYWFLRRTMRQDQELLADAAAVALAGPIDYAAMLVEWARHFAAMRYAPVSNAVGIWERPSELSRRVAAILHQPHAVALCCSGRTRVAVVLGMSALSVLATTLSVRSKVAESAPPEPNPSRTRPTAEAKAVAVRVVDAQAAIAAGAVVVACISGKDASVLETRAAVTDVRGVAVLDVRGGKCRVHVATQDGTLAGQAVVAADARGTTITLTPAARIAGRLLSDALTPISGRRLLCYLTEQNDAETLVPLKTVTDGKGRFAFAGVPAGAKARLILVKPRVGAFAEGVSFVVKEPGALDLGDVLDREFIWSFKETPRDEHWLPAISSASADMWDARNVTNVELAKAYRLQPGENVKRFVAPYPAARSVLIKQQYSSGTANGRFDPALTFYLHRDKLLDAGGTFSGANPTTRSLASIIETVCGIGTQEIEGAKELMELQIAGDFVIRLGVPAEKRVSELEQILWKLGDARVQLNLEHETRKVLVAEGDFALKPLADQGNAIVLYSRLTAGRPNTEGNGGGSGSLEEFLQHTAGVIGKRIINRVQRRADRSIVWRNTQDRDPELVLKHVTEQTGLTFREETQSVRILRVE